MDNIESETLTPSAALATYGKSFNWAKKFLGKTMGTDAAILYRFCRVLDDMADGDIIDGPERLFKIRDGLLKNYQTDDPLLIEFELFITSKKLPKLVIISLMNYSDIVTVLLEQSEYLCVMFWIVMKLMPQIML